MGMDVYGKKPKNEIGEYFRNNVWWWRPLWGYIEDNFPEIAAEVPNAHYNDGDGLNAVKTKILANKLRSHINSGKVKEYELAYKEKIDSLPLQDCEYCEQTGKRAWAATNFAVQSLLEKNELLEMNDQGEYILECNSCRGTGKTEHFMSHYPFAEENVISFCDFLENCGGFRIC